MRYSRWLPMLAVLTSCEVFEADYDVVHGQLSPVGVIMSGTAVVGQPYHVDLQTIGNNCYTFHATEVKLDGPVAEIRPFDRVERDGPCDQVKLIDHPATLRFNAPGYVTVRVIGKYPNGVRDTAMAVVRVQ